MPNLSIVPTADRISDSVENWRDWRWQLRNSIRDLGHLEDVLPLKPEEQKILRELVTQGGLPFRMTPHFLRQILNNPHSDALRAQIIPSDRESDDLLFQRRDPLGEVAHEAVPHLIHRYSDRALLFVTDRCAAYCRYCTRKRLVGQGPTPRKQELDGAIDYIANHSEIKDVILSGGDALLLDDDVLCSIINRLTKIPHVDLIRIATRMLTFAPMRFTPELLQRLRQHQPIYFLVHINHPDELSQEAVQAITAVADAGFPLLNQSVLLQGVNDDINVLKTLFHRLSTLRVRPYYLHQCDLVEKTAGFRVPIKQAIRLYGELRGHLSGFSIPTFVVDVPGGYGKVSLAPDPIVGEDESQIYLKGFDGRTAAYPLN